MVLPLVSRWRAASRKRKERSTFLRGNPDVRKMHGAGKARANGKPPASALLSRAELEHWNDFGYLVLKGFFERSVIDDYRDHIDHLWQARARAENPLVIWTNDGWRHFRDAVDDDRAPGYRLLDQYLVDAATRDICMHPRLTAVLGQLMGHAPVVCNTLLFEWGSEQDMHSDMFYMPPISENQMLATWIAIDDVTESNGPLVYVPGSHKLPPHRFSHGEVHAVTDEVPGAVAAIEEKLSELGLRPQHFLAERGDVLIWHSQLMHGGAPIEDYSERRRSLVTHYYSTCDVGKARMTCAETTAGSLLLMKKHLAVVQDASPSDA